MLNYRLTDRVAMITGANNPQGIGAATALAFAREGAKVVLVYKKIQRPFDAEKIDSAVAECERRIEEALKATMVADSIAKAEKRLLDSLATVERNRKEGARATQNEDNFFF